MLLIFLNSILAIEDISKNGFNYDQKIKQLPGYRVPHINISEYSSIGFDKITPEFRRQPTDISFPILKTETIDEGQQIFGFNNNLNKLIMKIADNSDIIENVLIDVESLNLVDIKAIRHLFVICITDVLNINNIDFLIDVVKSLRKRRQSEFETVLNFILEFKSHYHEDINLTWLNMLFKIQKNYIYEKDTKNILLWITESISEHFNKFIASEAKKLIKTPKLTT